MTRIAELWRYPVKSMGGERLDDVAISHLGLDGDRRWGVRDDDTGRILTGRREPRLLHAGARCSADGVVVTLPDGTETDTSDDLSAWLDRPVTLVEAGDDGGIYENPDDVERETGWRRWQGPGHAWHDSGEARVSVVSQTTLGGWDPRRFRANVVLDDADEDALVGSEVVLGDVRLRVTKRISRCIMVTRSQPGIDQDLDVLRTVNRQRAGCLAVATVVAGAGTVAVGDALTPAPLAR